MARPALCMFATTVGATVLAAGMGPTAKADQVVVFPGMEIHQAGHLCTLGYVDPVRRVAFTAGHCHGDGPVTDEDDHVIGTSATFRANTADGAPVAADQFVADYESIVLADDVTPNNVLPGGRVLESIPGVVARPGEPVCHFGIVTGESCGTIASVNNGWFTIGHGFTSEKGDSGGPVYVVNGPGRAAIVGLFNSIWGDFRTAVSWQAIAQQVAEDVQGASPGAAPAS